MEQTTHIYFYQNMVCPHVSPLIKELSYQINIKVTWVVDTEILGYRKKMGIELTDCGLANVIVTTNAIQIKDIIINSDLDSIHILSGLRSSIASRVAFKNLINTKRRIGLFTEAANHIGFSGYCRRLLYKLEYFRWGRNFDFILAMGELGVNWFVNSGFKKNIVFPFCYVTKIVRNNHLFQKKKSSRFKIIYCGQLIKRKSIGTLLKSLKIINNYEWDCQIIGNGILLEELKFEAIKLGISDKISWLGVLPNEDVLKHIEQSDLLILPSQFDGWGAVINESLSVGTPVICSNSSGASEFLYDNFRGEIFVTGSYCDLAKKIESRLLLGEVKLKQRLVIQNWCVNKISGVEVAKYLIQILEHIYDNKNRPLAPWRT